MEESWNHHGSITAPRKSYKSPRPMEVQLESHEGPMGQMRPPRAHERPMESHGCAVMVVPWTSKDVSWKSNVNPTKNTTNEPRGCHGNTRPIGVSWCSREQDSLVNAPRTPYEGPTRSERSDRTPTEVKCKLHGSQRRITKAPSKSTPSGSPMRVPCKSHGIIMELPRGPRMPLTEVRRDSHGSAMEVSWKSHGSPNETRQKSLGTLAQEQVPRKSRSKSPV